MTSTPALDTSATDLTLTLMQRIQQLEHQVRGTPGRTPRSRAGLRSGWGAPRTLLVLRLPVPFYIEFVVFYRLF